MTDVSGSLPHRGEGFHPFTHTAKGRSVSVPLFQRLTLSAHCTCGRRAANDLLFPHIAPRRREQEKRKEDRFPRTTPLKASKKGFTDGKTVLSCPGPAYRCSRTNGQSIPHITAGTRSDLHFSSVHPYGTGDAEMSERVECRMEEVR